ncbi:conserved hypothetical protein [Ricinus communis]|uniref:Uncharacterized protein n=1 Tax=Ricinus communis TaxID=3988 RepID=B9S5J5_RICCO|nr:conserved hypothetical protein [Ricinus communis]
MLQHNTSRMVAEEPSGRGPLDATGELAEASNEQHKHWEDRRCVAIHKVMDQPRGHRPHEEGTTAHRGCGHEVDNSYTITYVASSRRSCQAREALPLVTVCKDRFSLE